MEQTKQIAMLFGHPRSGTNVTVRAIEKSPDVTLFNENHPAAFRKANLISIDILPKVASTANTRIALFKPIAATRDIQKFGAIYPDAGYILMFRHYSAVRHSYVKAFGERGHRAVRRRFDRHIFDSTVSIFSDINPGFDPQTMSFDDNFILSWCHDTRMMLEFYKEFKKICAPTVYESLIEDPRPAISRICDLLGIEFLPSMIEGISQKSFEPPEVEANRKFLDYAEDLYQQARECAK